MNISTQRNNLISFWSLTSLILIILIIRVLTLSSNELSWDVFGYYLYLPSVFIHHDPFLSNIDWMKELVAQHQISGTLYQVSMGPKGVFVYFYLMGMSLLYLPFFLTGHITAVITDAPTDGFSLPYQYSLALGFVLYSFIGLWFFRKILLEYFSDKLTAIILVIIVLGTNFLQYATVKNLEQTNALFNLMAIITWFTIKWHKRQKLRYLIFISLSCSLMVLVKPSEIFCYLIPLLWGVFNRSSLHEKIRLLVQNKKQLIFAAFAGLMVFLPQMLYWKIAAGSFIYDSYNNPGVGLDLFSPHIGNVLFSFRKGWLIYTPVMIFAIAGFYLLYQEKEELFPIITVFFLLSFWIISSWTEWWYGASYSSRPFITSYVLLALPLGLTLKKILTRQIRLRLSALTLITAFIFLNLFQLWQFNHYILDFSRTTRQYYMAVFGRTSVPEGAQRYLLKDRSATGINVFTNETDYTKSFLAGYDFSSPDPNHPSRIIYDQHSKNYYCQLDSNTSFSPAIKKKYTQLTNKDHVWIRAQVDIFIPRENTDEPPLLVMTFSRREGLYGYNAIALPKDSIRKGEWLKLNYDYLTPDIRSAKDEFQCYMWYRGKKPVFIDNLKADVFVPK